MIWGLVIGEEFLVVFDFGIVIHGLNFAIIKHAEKGFFVVFDVINKEDAVEVVNFVK